MPAKKKTYRVKLSNRTWITVEAVSGPKAIQAAAIQAPEGVTVVSVHCEVPVRGTR